MHSVQNLFQYVHNFANKTQQLCVKMKIVFLVWSKNINFDIKRRMHKFHKFSIKRNTKGANPQLVLPFTVANKISDNIANSFT